MVDEVKQFRIVIVTYNWPPRNAIGTHRPYAWARYWSEAGMRVTVLTADKKAFDEPLDLQLPSLPGVEVVSVPYGGRRILLADLLKNDWVRNQGRKFLSWFSRKAGKRHDPRLGWLAAAKELVPHLARECDVVVSSFGPSAAHLIGCEIKKHNPSVLWVADYRDLWSQQHYETVAELEFREVRDLEVGTVGKYADALVAVSVDMARQLTELMPKPASVIQNGFDLDLDLVRDRLNEKVILPNGPIRIVYTGMIYKGQRDPLPLLESLVRLEARGEIPVDGVTVDFYGSRVEVARQLARNPAYAPFIRLMGHVTRAESLKVQRGADVLLLLESSDSAARGVLTGKIFEYIAAARPILCVGSRPEFEIGKVLSDTKTGVVVPWGCDDELDDILRETFLARGIYLTVKPDFDEIQKYSRKSQSMRLLDFIFEINSD